LTSSGCIRALVCERALQMWTSICGEDDKYLLGFTLPYPSLLSQCLGASAKGDDLS